MENDTQTFGFNVEVTPTGVVDAEGKFVPIDQYNAKQREHDAAEADKAERFVQTDEDVIVD